jgi:hypothetical protein
MVLGTDIAWPSALSGDLTEYLKISSEARYVKGDK